MKLYRYIFITFIIIFISCTEIKKSTEEGISTTPTIQSNPAEKVSRTFDINDFKIQADSLLQYITKKPYTFDIESDTFRYLIDDHKAFNLGHGIYWELYRGPSEKVVRHYLPVPKTNKQFRIYLAEAEYKNNDELYAKIADLKTTMNHEMGCPGCTETDKMRLSPIHDYVIVGNRKLFWLNMGYPYSNTDFLQFIDILKQQLDHHDFKGKIICLIGSDCEDKNVP